MLKIEISLADAEALLRMGGFADAYPDVAEELKSAVENWEPPCRCKRAECGDCNTNPVGETADNE